jgi:isopenicillin-N N-acyltransferase like protein
MRILDGTAAMVGLTLRLQPRVAVLRGRMPDLVIGGRRSSLLRPWRAALIGLALLGTVVVVAWFIYRRAVVYEVPAGTVQGEIATSQAVPGGPPTLAYQRATFQWLGGLGVLRVRGDEHAVGAAHGRLLGPQLAKVIAAALPSIEATVPDGGWLGGLTRTMRLAWRWRFIDDGMSEADRRMIAGMTRGAAASGVALGFADVLRAQAILDVGAPAPDSGLADLRSITHTLAVVAPQAQAPARMWLGHVVALPGVADGGDSAVPLVQVVHPPDRQAWASVGWPGQLGALTGINAQGIAVAVIPARTADVRTARTARPVGMLARGVLEHATTLDEAIKLVEQTPSLGAATFVLVDGSTGAWAVVERTPSKAIVDRAPKRVAFGDVLVSSALAPDPENERARRVLPTMARVERASRLVRGPLPDVAAMAAVLRDRRGLDDAPLPAGHRGAIDDGRARLAVILDPAALELWVADPSALGRMRAFDLRHELRGDGDRPMPPADIAAEPEAEPDRLANLVAARAHLRAARAALAAGDRVRASEACARARARAPQLPEALELEAKIALARGDDERARGLFRQWLDGEPDDPIGEQRARSLLAR